MGTDLVIYKPPQRPRRILIVDATATWRKRVRKVVIACGHYPTCSFKKRNALELIRTGIFDLLIVSNWIERYDDGLKFLEDLWLRELETPAILLTSALSAAQQRRLACLHTTTHVHRATIAGETLLAAAIAKRFSPEKEDQDSKRCDQSLLFATKFWQN